MKLLIFKLFGLILLISMTFSKSSLKNTSSNSNSNAKSKFPAETVAFGYASNENILQNAAVIIIIITIIFQLQLKII